MQLYAIHLSDHGHRQFDVSVTRRYVLLYNIDKMYFIFIKLYIYNAMRAGCTHITQLHGLFCLIHKQTGSN